MATIAIPIVKEGDGRFWSEFSEGIMAMVQKRSFLVSPMKYRGYEKYWAIYLDFISDVTNNRNISNSLALMSDGFQKRNKDMRLNESGCPIDGSGNTPVKWDFRGESLKKYAAEAYGLNFGLTS